MAHWQSGEKDEVRQGFNRAVAWMDKHAPTNQKLRHFRSEAADVLGIEAESQPVNWLK